MAVLLPTYLSPPRKGWGFAAIDFIKAKGFVKEFIIKYRKELEEMWETEKYAKLPQID